MILSDIHVHTKYCDGKNETEEIVKKAIELGFESIGISGHSYTDWDLSFCMSLEDTKKYADEIEALKIKYPQTDVLLGIERDYYYTPDGIDYDYVIGSLHYVEKDGVRMSVDESEEVFVNNVGNYFGGDYRAFAESYYNTLKDIVTKTNADVVGHIDLVSKFNDGNKYFDENSQWYTNCVRDCLKEITKSKPVFEVNTGAISRGYKTKPYPAKFILEEIKKMGCDIIITSDCHNADNLGYAFNEAVELVKECGFNSVKILTKEGFRDREVL